MNLYVDTSALVKLYVREQGSEHVRAFVDQVAELSTSFIALVEIRSALMRKQRSGELSPEGHKQVREDLERDWSHFATVVPGPTLLREAARLAEAHGLRALDAIHLASALDVRGAVLTVIISSGLDVAQEQHVFLCANQRLAAAAADEGFNVPMILT